MVSFFFHPHVSEGRFCFCRCLFRDVETPPVVDLIVSLLFHYVCFTAYPPTHPTLGFEILLFFQTACARTPRGLSTVKGSIAATTSDTIV
jgi:hypothetical protein